TAKPEKERDTRTAGSKADDIQPLFKALEEHLELKQLRESRQAMRDLQTAFDSLDRKAADPWRNRLALLIGQLRELEDWQRFAVVPKLTALCEQMEGLAEHPQAAESQAAQIREFQQAWRDLGGSSDQTLWKRFKSASDQAFEHCKAYFEAREALMAANLTRRESLCEQLTQLLDNIDWPRCDWKGLERISRAARDEWKATQEVDFKANRHVQKRFNALLGRLDGALDTERQRNLGIKKRIVQDAESLLELNPLSEALDRAKRLQRDWQTVGITPSREDRALWTTFRAVCDRVFARREQHRQAQEAEMHQAREQLLARVARLDADTLTSDERRQCIDSLLAELDVLPIAHDDRRAVQADLRQRLEQLDARHNAEQQVQRVEHIKAVVTEGSAEPGKATLQKARDWLSTRRETPEALLHELVIRAELLSGHPGEPGEAAERMSLQIRRLNEGLQQGMSWSSPLDEAEFIGAAWVILTAEHAELARAHTPRLLNALDRLR
ncbi:MAG: DUF349 domain-containing protein, partial [Gammaproteobacteria bacterium]|nr:DUF349 domain-containing protein [Gammaproteobacteria bacterium]